MKLSGSKVKGMDFKQMLVNHGEKAVLGLAVVIALFALSKTNWVSFKETTPSALKEKAVVAAVLIDKNPWPDAQRDKFPLNDTLAPRIEMMKAPIPLAELTPLNGMSFDLYIPQRKHIDPKLYPVVHLIAEADRMVVLAQVENQFVNGTEDGEPTDQPMGTGTDAGKTQPNSKKRKLKDTNAAGAGSGTGGEGSGESSEGGVGVGAAAGVPSMPMDTSGGYSGGKMGSGDEGGSGVGGTGKGYHVISVRGIFELNRQLLQFAKALNLPSDDPSRIRPFLNFEDVIVERQVSLDRGKTWAKWQPIDIAAYSRFLRTKIGDYDPDVVDQRVTDAVITSPLPARLLWTWASEATHPDIAEYKLSPAQQEAQRLRQENLIKNRAQVEQSRRKSRRTKGFRGSQNDMQEIGGLVGDDARASGEFQKNLGDAMSGGSGVDNTDLVKQEMKKIAAIGNLLLFRFFDFTVEPGMMYRYRVKLSLFNPNFRKSLSMMAAGFETSVTEETKTTPVSNETPPIFVPFDVKYFLTRADAPVGSQLSNMAPPTANVRVYQWFSEYGTVVKGQLDSLEVGQTVAGIDLKTIVIEPAIPAYRKEVKTEFETNVTLVDIEPGSTGISSRFMRELGLPISTRGNLDIQDEIVVVDPLGRLRILDKLSERSAEKDAEGSWSVLNEHYKKHEVSSASTEGGPDGGMPSSLDGLYEGENGEGGSGKKGGKYTRGGRRKGSALRPGGSSGSGGGYPGSSGGSGDSPDCR